MEKKMKNLPACCKSANRGPEPEFYFSCGHLLDFSWLGDLRNHFFHVWIHINQLGRFPWKHCSSFQRVAGFSYCHIWERDSLRSSELPG